MPEEKRHPFFAAAPAVAGAGLSLRKALAGRHDYPGFLAPSAGVQASELAAAAGSVFPSRARSATEALAGIATMERQMAWRSLPFAQARHAINEATRASIQRAAYIGGRTLSRDTSFVDSLSAKLLTASPETVFQEAALNIRKYGDPITFYKTMQDFIQSGGTGVGAQWTQEEVDAVIKKGISGPYSRRWVKMAQLPETERSMLNKYLSMTPAGWTTSIGKRGPAELLQESALPMQDPTGAWRRGYNAQLSFASPSLERAVTIPMPLTAGWRRSGEWGESLYTTQKILEGGRVMEYGEYRMQNVLQTLAGIESKSKTLGRPLVPAEAREFVNAMEERLSSYSNWVSSTLTPTPGQVAINALNQQVIGVPALSPEAVRVSGANVDAEMQRLFEQGYYPAGSPGQIQAGKVMAVDPRSYRMFGEVFPIERRPLQGIRPLGPTVEARAAMATGRFGPAGIFERGRPFLATPEMVKVNNAGYIGPQLAVTYVVPGSPVEKAMQRFGLAQENILLEKQLMPMLAREELTQMDLALNEYVSSPTLKRWITENVGVSQAKQPFTLPAGERIGYEWGSGAELRTLNLPGVSQEIRSAELVPRGQLGTVVRLHVATKHMPQQYAKLFGDFKKTTVALPAAVVKERVQGVGLPYRRGMAYAYADELLKSRAALRQQMVTGLGWSVAQRVKDINTAMQVTNAARLQVVAARRALANLPPGASMQMINARKFAIARKQAAYSEANKVLSYLNYQTSPAATAEMSAFFARPTNWTMANLADETAIVARARAWGLDIGPISGLAEEAVGKGILPKDVYNAMAQAAGGPEALRATRGFVVGMGTAFPGAWRYSGGGGLTGSMEPRGFQQLMQHQWATAEGNASTLMAADIVRSMRSYGTEFTEAERAFAVMAGKGIPGAQELALSGLTIGKSPVVSRDLIMGGGQYVGQHPYTVTIPGAPAGANRLYVPAFESIEGMGYVRGATGELFAGDLMKAYHNTLLRANEAIGGGWSATAAASYKDAYDRLSHQLLGTLRMGITGTSGGQATLRGSVMGSVALAPGPLLSGVAQSMNVAEISEAAVRRGYGEMIANAASPAERAVIQAEMDRVLGGGMGTATTWRHGLIGPYSVQPMQFRVSRAAGSASEMFVNMPAQMKSVMTTSLPGKAAKMEVDISPALGMALDYDDDRQIVKFIGDQKTKKAVDELLNSGRYRREYQRFAAESTLLIKLAKGRAAEFGAELGSAEQLALGAAKLRIGVGEVGKISTALSEARLAYATYASPAEASRFMLMSEIMEQTIISGKHMKSLRENIAGVVSSGLRYIASDADKQALVESTRGLFGPELSKPVQLSMEGVGTWQFAIGRGGDPVQAFWNQTQRYLQMARAPGGASETWRRLVPQLQEGAAVNTSEVMRFAAASRGGTADMLSSLAMWTSSPVGGFTATSRRTISAINQGLKTGGAAIKQWGKPALYGLGLTAGLSMLLAAPKQGVEVITPPAAERSQTTGSMLGTASAIGDRQLQGLQVRSTDMRPESYNLAQNVSGSPTAPGMPTPEHYMTTAPIINPARAARHNMRLALDSSGNPNDLAKAMRTLAPSANIRITVNDRRRKMSSSDVEEMMEGY